MMLERGTRVGRYVVIGPMGHGGTSFVYKAKSHDGSIVALKFPDRPLNAEEVQQFRIEGMSLTRLSHPNIVVVLTVAMEQGWPYIVMKFVDGWTLSEEISAKKTFSPEEIFQRLGPIAAALDYVHAHNNVHRDVKPGNIRVSRQQTPVLVDFGTVQTGSGETSGRIRATPWYMSPEQVQRKRATGQSDQYSLAIVTYEMLAGRLPFDGEPTQVARDHVYAVPPIPRTWNETLKAWILRGLDKKPEKRFPSCRDFIHGLREGYMATSA